MELSPVDHGAVVGLVELHLPESRKVGVEPAPHPGHDVLCRGIVEDPIEIVVVDFGEDVLAHRLFHFAEIDGKSGLGINRPLDENEELVVMPVSMEARALVTGQPVCGVELKLDSKNQRRPPPSARRPSLVFPGSEISLA
jgi:hypothetical protein